MRVSDPSPPSHRVRRRAPCPASILVILATAIGCAAPAAVEVPSELPLVTNDQGFDLRWALQREAARTRAAGRARPSFNTEFHLTLGLFGLDTTGRIVSRATTYVQSDFGRQAAPFSVEISPTGQEARYELRVLDYHLTGLRSG